MPGCARAAGRLPVHVLLPSPPLPPLHWGGLISGPRHPCPDRSQQLLTALLASGLSTSIRSPMFSQRILLELNSEVSLPPRFSTVLRTRSSTHLAGSPAMGPLALPAPPGSSFTEWPGAPLSPRSLCICLEHHRPHVHLGVVLPVGSSSLPAESPSSVPLSIHSVSYPVSYP